MEFWGDVAGNGGEGEAQETAPGERVSSEGGELMRDIKYFHILCDGTTLRELDEKVFLRLIRDERLKLGWIDKEALYIREGLVKKEMLLRILKWGGWLQ